MFNLNIFTAAAVVAAVALNVQAAPLVSREDKPTPATYAEGYLELYKVYHTRYLAIGCQNQHNTQFFDDCCHPLLATETLENNRAAYCNPVNIPAPTTPAPAPAPVQPPTPADTDGDDEDCEEDGDEPAAAPAPEVAAPTPADSPAPAPVPETAPAPAPETPAPAPQAPSSGNSGDNDGGFATFFFQNGVAGACGTVHQDSDFIVAMQSERYGNTYPSALCGQQVVITNKNNGKTVTCTVADECPTCINANSIDLSQAAFNAIASEADGLVPITWSFV